MTIKLKPASYLHVQGIADLLLIWLHVVVASLIGTYSVRQSVDLRLIIWQMIAMSLIFLAMQFAFEFRQSLSYGQRFSFQRLSMAKLLQTLTTSLFLLCCASWIFISTTTSPGYYSLSLLLLVGLSLALVKRRALLHAFLHGLFQALLYLTVFLSYRSELPALFWVCASLVFLFTLALDYAVAKSGLAAPQLLWLTLVRYLMPLSLLLLT